MKGQLMLIRCVSLIALLLPTLSFAQGLHTFENGQVADADKINQNFNYVLENASGGCSASELANGTSVNCADGSSGFIASGKCTASQEGSNVRITCLDGTSGLLASAGTVVTFLDGEIGANDYTFNTGAIVITDALDAQLGEFGGYGTNDRLITILQKDPVIKVEMVNDPSTSTVVLRGAGAGDTVFFEESDCQGAAFTSENSGDFLVSPNLAPTQSFYLATQSQFSNKVVNSSKSTFDRCRNSNEVLRNAYLVVPYTPAPEILNAAYPVRLEQLP